MKLKITYREVSIILGILVAILAIFSYWLTLQQEFRTDTSLQTYPFLDFEITKISNFIHTTLQVTISLFSY